MAFPMSMAYWLRSRVTADSRQEMAAKRADNVLITERELPVQMSISHLTLLASYCEWRSLDCEASSSAVWGGAAPWTRSETRDAAGSHFCPECAAVVLSCSWGLILCTGPTGHSEKEKSVHTRLIIVVSNAVTWESMLDKRTNIPCASLLSLCLYEPCRSLNKSPAWPEWWGSGPDSAVWWSIDPPVQDSVKGDKMAVSRCQVELICILLCPQ